MGSVQWQSALRKNSRLSRTEGKCRLIGVSVKA
jgi:hypothetical protein